VIGKKAVHLMTPDDREKASKTRQLWVDVGASSRDEVVSLGIRVGDPIVLAQSMIHLAGNRIASRAIDNRIGAFIVPKVSVKSILLNGRPISSRAIFAVRIPVKQRPAEDVKKDVSQSAPGRIRDCILRAVEISENHPLFTSGSERVPVNCAFRFSPARETLIRRDFLWRRSDRITCFPGKKSTIIVRTWIGFGWCATRCRTKR